MSEFFLNPYNFVSIPDRTKLPTALADGSPPGHDRYLPGHWSGSIPVTITTATPLLIPDHTAAAQDDPLNPDRTPTLPVRLDHRNRPLLAESAVKGMLRSAYEAITNSRMSVFSTTNRLAIRATATREVAERLRPAEVVERGRNRAVIRWVDRLTPTGTTEPGPEPSPAVWVPIRLLGQLCDGAEVDAWIHLMHHQAKKFRCWQASAIGQRGTLGGSEPGDVPNSNTMFRQAHPPVLVRGRLHRTGSTFPAGGRKKHDERLVVSEVLQGDATVRHRRATIDQRMIDGWQAVIDSFQQAHETEGDLRNKYGTYISAPALWRELNQGRTLHVELNRGGNVVGLYPAMIGRKPFPGTPWDSLPVQHRPATKRDELSPADRVFGWIREGADDGAPAYRGHLRIDSDARPDPDSVHTLAESLTLTTLNSPKPAQFLFYLGDQKGQPLKGQAKRPENGYPTGPDALETRRLRGRKVYLTHADILDGKPAASQYWTPTADATKGQTPERYREYEAPPPNAERKVSTTISHWVKAGTTFQFTLRVDNLTAVELGALLWLLNLPKGACHKIGLGKPLGFGAVHVEANIDKARLYTGSSLTGRYRSLMPSTPTAPAENVTRLSSLYTHLVDNNTDLRKVCEQFLAAARGYPDTSFPVHYPRKRREPTATTYDWWVANDAAGSRNGPVGQRHALPILGKAAPSLPYDPQKQSPQQGPAGGERHRGRPSQRGRRNPPA